MKRLLPALTFFALALAVVLPWYRPGYLFLLDMTMPPALSFAALAHAPLSPQLPLTVLITLLAQLLPTAFIQKILLTGVLLLPGFTAAHLARRVLPAPWHILAGVFAMMNPWVYERLHAGHWLVLLGYGLYPLALAFLFDALTRPTRGRISRCLLLFALYPLMSLHWAYLAWLTAPLATAVWYLIAPSGTRPSLRRIGITALAGLLLAGAVNAFWLPSFFTSPSPYARITAADLTAFATRADPQWGVWTNALALYGFWDDASLLPKDTMPYWPFLALMIAAASAVGAMILIRRREPLGFLLAILAPLALLIGVGAGCSFTRPLIEFLVAHTPGFRGLRETGKVLGILALFYALCAPYALWRISIMIRAHAPFASRALIPFMITAAALLPLLTVYRLFWGFSGSITPADYPPSWYTARAELLADPTVGRVLFLPWHGYLSFPFTDARRIANPAPRFFAPLTLIAATTTDNDFLTHTPPSELDDALFRLVQGVRLLDEERPLFDRMGITHILVARARVPEQYAFTHASPFLTPILTTENLVLYRLR